MTANEVLTKIKFYMSGCVCLDLTSPNFLILLKYKIISFERNEYGHFWGEGKGCYLRLIQHKLVFVSCVCVCVCMHCKKNELRNTDL